LNEQFGYKIDVNEYTFSVDKSMGTNRNFYNNYIKRCVDFALALVLSITLLPLMVIIAILIKINPSGPIFYRGIRTGRYGRPFKIFKFRSMVQSAENIGGGTTALNDSRITKIGAVLRKCKIDEIPQLFNILKGDMSFIGPRPELLRYTELYDNDEKIILSIRPGMTDISSLEFISLDEIVGSDNPDDLYEKYVLKKKNKLRMDYVIKQSAYLDIKLFFQTITGVLKKTIRVVFRKKERTSIYGIHNTEKF
jgi:lipopolysaccharide/colanic/teichoic acid biosynthesis glycosyltransferase